MQVFTRFRTTLVLVVVAAACFAFGASTRGSGAVALKGSVVDVVTVGNIPADVNRWCLVKDGGSRATTMNVAIVEFAEGPGRRRYAYPQTPASSLAAHDTVSSDIVTCSITKVANG